LCSHHEVIVVVSLIVRSSQTKRDTNATIYRTANGADMAYDEADRTEQPVAYVAILFEGQTLPNNGIIIIGDNIPATNEPLRMGYGFEFFLRTYPLDVSMYI